jgi:hypothetical protein
MIAWLTVLLPWYYLSYYFLPFLFGSALFGGAVLGKLVELLRSETRSDTSIISKNFQNISGITSKKWLWVCCVITFLLIIPPAVNAIAYATEQLTFDKANWKIIEQVKSLPANSQLLINIPSEVEYFYEFQLYVSQICGRPDIKIKSYQPSYPLPPGEDIYIASPNYSQQVLPAVRALNALDVIAWGESLDHLTKQSELIHSIRIRRPIVDIGLHRILSFLQIYDLMGHSNRPIFVSITLDYGWDLWKYSPSK